MKLAFVFACADFSKNEIFGIELMSKTSFKTYSLQYTVMANIFFIIYLHMRIEGHPCHLFRVGLSKTRD